MLARLSLLVVLAAVTSLEASNALAIEVTAEQSDQGVVVKIDGQLFAEYIKDSAGRPIVWPILGPTGKPMTRDYPMAKRPEEKTDHPHQRSLWFNHGDVNGVNFWMLQDPTVGSKDAGTIRHIKFVQVSSGKPATIVTENEWLTSGGKRLCTDERTLRFDTDGSARWIDFDITVKATDGPVTFGDTKEGTFAVRVAHSMTVDAKQGGKIVNSRGQIDGNAWAQQADWVDYHGPIDGQTVGIAIFNHPSSFRYPTYWHVREYGLFAANPFGLREFTKDEKADGSHAIPAGESMTLRYRVFMHAGDEKEGKVAEAFDAYAAGK